jgi:peptidoglycan-associated lipoprotein
MKLKKWIQIAVVISSMVALTACSSKRKPQDELAINDANSSYSEGDPQSSGLGDESKFSEEGSSSSRTNMAAHRVYHFDYDSNVVHEDDKVAIEANAATLSGNQSKKAMVEGHTDPRGSREYNIGLGERRAKAVAQIMTANGVNRDQVRVVSYGAEKPASQGHSESDYQRDRRAVLMYLQQ